MIRLSGTYFASGLRELLRVPAFWVPTVLFPAMLFLFFGNSFQPSGASGGNFMLASWTVYGVLGIAFYQFGIGIAQDRETPWDRYLKVLPASLAPRLIARVATALLFAIAAAFLVAVVALVSFPIAMTAGDIAALVIALLFGGAVFALFGIGLGYTLSARAAVPVANLIYLPLAFLGGLWVPPQALPAAIAPLSQMTPTRHFAEIAWAAVGAEMPFPLASVAILAGYGVVFGGLALWGYHRDWSTRYR